MEISRSQNTTAAPSMCTRPIDWLADRKDFLERYSLRECSLIPNLNVLDQLKNIGISYVLQNVYW